MCSILCIDQERQLVSLSSLLALLQYFLVCCRLLLLLQTQCLESNNRTTFVKMLINPANLSMSTLSLPFFSLSLFCYLKQVPIMVTLHQAKIFTLRHIEYLVICRTRICNIFKIAETFSVKFVSFWKCVSGLKREIGI